jgi:glutamine synthetase
MDGVKRKLDPGAPEQTPYESKAAHLPRSLEEAVAALKADEALQAGLGTAFVDYYCRIKEAEIARFNLEVSDWEHREYFDLF